MHDVMSDTWVASDALGRALPGHDECGDPRTGRFVGIFYFLWLGQHTQEGPFDNTRLIAENPEAPAWEAGRTYHWGEPEVGYYLSTDRWVIRRHAHLLADAGVDTLIFDATNDRIYPEALAAVCETLRQVRSEGERTPDICFLASRESIRKLWEQVYLPGLYEDLWLRWKGRPLLLFGQHIGMPREEDLPQDVRSFFTLRASWAWDSLPWYGDGGYHRWPWVAHHPQPVGWDTPGTPEQVPVAIGQHPLSNRGRSYHNGRQPETDRYYLTPHTGEGLCFQEQWDRALSVDPEFVFVTGWNEWIAGSVRRGVEETDEDLHRRWCFYPGAPMTRGGRVIGPGDIYFIDQFNQEFSRDAEPMRGGHTDNYYYQLVANVRRYKGVRRPPIAGLARTIDTSGPFAQWDGVGAVYRDHLGETQHRDEKGWGSVGRLTNRTGRNEFVELRATHDDTSIHFLATCAADVTPWTDPHWMMLFLNLDRRPDTGWHGFDAVVNLPPLGPDRTSVRRNAGGWRWEPSGEARYRVEGKRLMVSVPREALGLPRGPVAFDFHWHDNLQAPGDRADWFLSGDSAPNRRFDYRYEG